MQQRSYYAKLGYCDKSLSSIWIKYKKGYNNIVLPRILAKSRMCLKFTNIAIWKYLSMSNSHAIVLDSSKAEKRN